MTANPPCPSPHATTQPPFRLDDLVHRWLAARSCTVAAKTLRVDRDLLRLIPSTYMSRAPQSIDAADIDDILSTMRDRNLSEPSIRRHRASLSQLFSWSVGTGVLSISPVTSTTVVAKSGPTEIRPFSGEELESAWRQWREHDDVLADVMLVLARTGVRWSEARVLTVADIEDGAITVDKAASEGGGPRRLASAQQRRVHIASRVVGIVTRLAAERERGDLLLTTSRGAQLHRSAVMRALAWPETGRGRRLHDLRHTAARLWLAEGVDPATVRSWMGHTRVADEQLAS